MDPTSEDEPDIDGEAVGTAASDLMAFRITGHKKPIADFIQAAYDSRPPLVGGVLSRWLDKLCEAIYKSARELRVVRLQ